MFKADFVYRSLKESLNIRGGALFALYGRTVIVFIPICISGLAVFGRRKNAFRLLYSEYVCSFANYKQEKS